LIEGLTEVLGGSIKDINPIKVRPEVGKFGSSPSSN